MSSDPLSAASEYDVNLTVTGSEGARADAHAHSSGKAGDERPVRPAAPSVAATLHETAAVMGCEPHDELSDLFPGTGAVTDAWESWRAQGRLAV